MNQTNYLQSNPIHRQSAVPNLIDFGILHDDECEQGTGYVALDCQCALRETTWVFREAADLMRSLAVLAPDDSPVRVTWEARSTAFKVRKLALLAYIEATK